MEGEVLSVSRWEASWQSLSPEAQLPTPTEPVPSSLELTSDVSRNVPRETHAYAFQRAH